MHNPWLRTLIAIVALAMLGLLRGKRIEFSVDLRTAAVNRAANVFFRADDATGKAVAFDNMWMNYDEDRTKGMILNRGDKGDTGWSTQHVVLEIPKEAVAVSYGVFLDGPGKVSMDNARIEVVSDEMPTTAPRATDLEEGDTKLGCEMLANGRRRAVSCPVEVMKLSGSCR